MASHLLIYCFAPDFIVNIKTSVGAGMPLNSYGSCYGFPVSNPLVSGFNPHYCYPYDLHPIYTRYAFPLLPVKTISNFWKASIYRYIS